MSGISNRAVWRASSSDSRSGLGRFFQEAGFPLRRFVRSLASSLILLGGFLFLNHDSVGGLILVTLGLISFYRREQPFQPFSGRLSKRVLPLLALPGPDLAFPCQVAVRAADGILVGKDVGVVTFVEGWLHYEGQRTSFSFTRASVRFSKNARLTFLDGGTIQFIPGDRLWKPDSVEKGLGERFYAQLSQWMKGNAAAGDSILPPEAVHFSGLARTQAEFVSAAAGLLFSAALFGFTAGPTLLGLVLWIPFWLGFLCAWRNLRRTERTRRALPSVVQ